MALTQFFTAAIFRLFSKIKKPYGNPHTNTRHKTLQFARINSPGDPACVGLLASSIEDADCHQLNSHPLIFPFQACGRTSGNG